MAFTLSKLKRGRVIIGMSLLYRAFSRYKRRIIILALLGFVSGLLEGVGVNAIIPLLSFVSSDVDPNADVISRAIQQAFAAFHLTFRLSYLLIFIALLFIVKAVVSFIAQYVSATITADYEREIRVTLFQKLMGSGWPYLLTQKTGYPEMVLTNDVNAASTALTYLSSAILLITALLIYVIIALNISVMITILALLMGVVIFVSFRPFLYRSQQAANVQAQLYKVIAHHVNESVAGSKSIKSFAVEIPVVAKAANIFKTLRGERIKLSRSNATTNSLIQPISLLFVLAVFSYFYLKGNFNVASFAVILYLIQKIFSYIQAIQSKLHSVSELVPNVRNTLEFLAAAEKNQEHQTGTAAFSFHQRLTFQSVTFGYQQDRGRVLDGISFEIPKGAMLGLIGASGAGKTTIVDLLLRHFSPTGGEILIDGKNISTVDLTAWRHKIGYISQDIFLLNDTVENNIKFYHPSISKPDMVAAAKMAQIHDFINQQPDGYQTMVGERGIMLSGGQRQRVILARALVRQPEILILDEATSSLDNESEIKVQQAIENLRGKITVLVIAHRLTTVMNCDQLLIIKDGQIQERGAPQALLKDRGSYFFKTYNIREQPQH
ncbi:MAG: hypothetical protein A3J59_03360 [Candidatus Buchananbacteria bacterium RIFCSPHIGHO2_02_FULL_56_16]|uniref:ABC transporter ATP-binding protein n=1 Tax=Candidatus Buchananbacteria bacterium RIFCSPHIGHO2_02_FULL_56_16 TaxID=1797542 RepID=A0A1G1YIS2_9BACT|nr:MAG: hypothetical protein A3J59_03360 [Candidatus Buchananbacteria bacterium RIFCSPHIGHO2_02_FULL_56_16]